MGKKNSLEIVGSKALFEMTVSGGNLPEDFDANISVEMSFETVSKEQMIKICASGQSARVALQGQLRKKSVQELVRLGNEGLRLKVEDIYSNNIVKPADKLLALSREDFVETMVQDLGLEENQAHEIFNRKHSLEEGSRE